MPKIQLSKMNFLKVLYKNHKLIHIYTLIINAIAIISIFFLPILLRRYIPIFIAIFGYFFFMFLFIISSKQMSEIIKINYPEIFKKHKRLNNNLKEYSISIFSHKKELENEINKLGNNDLIKLSSFTKSTYIYATISFFEFIIISLIIILLT